MAEVQELRELYPNDPEAADLMLGMVTKDPTKTSGVALKFIDHSSTSDVIQGGAAESNSDTSTQRSCWACNSTIKKEINHFRSRQKDLTKYDALTSQERKKPLKTPQEMKAPNQISTFLYGCFGGVPIEFLRW